MNICYVTRNMIHPPIEGNHIASRRLIEASTLAGFDPSVITIEPEGETSAVPKNWTKVNSILKSSSNDSFFPRIYETVNDMLTSMNIATLIKSSSYEIIHLLNVSKEAYLLAHSLLRIKKPLLLHFFHSSYVLKDDVFLVRNMSLKAGLYGHNSDNYALATNFSLTKLLVEDRGADPKHVIYLPYPVDTDTFNPIKDKDELRAKYALPLDKPVIAYVGSLSFARGLFDLVKSFKHLLQKCPDALLFISYAKREGEKAEEDYLYTMVRDLGYQGNVIISGPSPNVNEIYNLADIVALPFRRPYWVDPPLVLLEAMSTGAAVISSHVGAIGEVVKDRENAILTKPGEPLLLAETMAELLKDPSKLRHIREEARKTIMRDYSYANVAKRLLTLYSQLD